MQISIAPHLEGWRFTLPRVIAAVMQIQAGETEIAGLLAQGYVEFWTMQTLRNSFAVPLADIF